MEAFPLWPHLVVPSTASFEEVMPLAVSGLLKIFSVFALILLLNRRGLPLSLCLFMGAFAIGLWMGLPLPRLLGVIFEEMTSPQTLWLAAIIVAILVLSNLLERSGQLQRIVETFGRLGPSRRFTTLAMPALIGLLPMPGGALFSAPMVQQSYPARERPPELMAAVNYWFRHIWEYWWPLYPGFVLAVSLLGVETWKFILAQFPLTVGAVLGGVLFIARHMPRATRTSPKEKVPLALFLREVMPIVLLLILLFAGQVLHPFLRPFLPLPPPKYFGFSLGLTAAIGWVMRENGLGGRDLLASVGKLSIPRMAMIIFGIMAFKGVLMRSSAMEVVRGELGLYGIHPLLIITMLPFISGLVTGIALGFVGTSFPLVLSLIPLGEVIPYGLLAYGFGYMGMMLTPMHLCLLVTKDYFRADFLKTYRYLWKAVLFVMLWTVGLFALYRAIL